MTWPTEFGGGGRAADRAADRRRGADQGRRPDRRVVVRRPPDGPDAASPTARPTSRRAFLPEILSGETTWCIGMSEPDAGSDLASLRTRAVRDGDDWVINGQKIWTSFGRRADYCYLICRTSTEGPPHAGISEIIVPMDTPGIEVRPIKDMTDQPPLLRGLLQRRARARRRTWSAPRAAAFKQTMRQLEHERGGIDRLVSNHALVPRWPWRAADTADPLVRQEIAALETGYRIGRLLVVREVLGQAPAGFSAATKSFCTEHEQRVADFVAARARRRRDCSGDAWRPRRLPTPPAYTIMGGTSNVLRNILGERVLGLPAESGRGPSSADRAGGRWWVAGSPRGGADAHDR